MLEKFSFDSDVWARLDKINCIVPPEQSIPQLIEEFQLTPDVNSDVFVILFDRIFQSNTCYPTFYPTLPYLIDIASQIGQKQASELWEYIGGWLGEGYANYDDVPADVLKIYEDWLPIGEKECLRIICENNLSDIGELHKFLAVPLAFINPKFGNIALQAFNEVGYQADSTAKCPEGHHSDFLIDDHGIINESGQKSIGENLTDIQKLLKDLPTSKDNPWIPIAEKMQQCLQHKSKLTDTKKYIEVAIELCKKGVVKQMPQPLVFILYGCMLLCFGEDEYEHKFANRCFHACDIVVCPECNANYIFAEGW